MSGASFPPGATWLVDRQEHPPILAASLPRSLGRCCGGSCGKRVRRPGGGQKRQKLLSGDGKDTPC